MASESKILTVQEAAKQLRITPWQIRHLITTGKLRAFSVGARSRKFWRIKQAAIDDYIASNQSQESKPALTPFTKLPLRPKRFLTVG